jgi:hypothetical protein
MNSMTSLPTRTISVVAVSLLLPCMAAVWLMLRPQTATVSTYAIFAALVVATGAIVIRSWQSAQATTNTSHLIYATEIASSVKR